MLTHKYKLGVIGLGNHFFKNIYPNLYKNNLFEICGAFSTSKKNKYKYYKGIKIYSTINSILKERDINYFYVSNISSLHFKTCLKLLKNKKNIICEKPLTLNEKDFIKLVNVAKKNNVVIFEAFMFKYHKNFLKLKTIINQNKKNIKSIDIKFNIPELKRNNFRYNKKKGGGAFLDLGCYTVKMLSLIIGSYKEVDKIYGFKLYDKKKVDLSGNAIILLKNNIICNLEWGFNKFYQNSIDINTSRKFIKAKKIFSKKTSEKTKINIQTNKNHDEMIINPDNHFYNMFYYFFLLCSNKLKYEIYINELIDYQKLYFKIDKSLLKCKKKY